MILDGALATQLQRRGANLHDPLWSAKALLEQPELIRAVHAEYFAAGADVAITASYQASFEGSDESALLALLRHDHGVEDEQLHSTAFIRTPDYGTRSSTLLRIDADVMARFREWTWHPDGSLADEVSEQFATRS